MVGLGVCFLLNNLPCEESPSIRSESEGYLRPNRVLTRLTIKWAQWRKWSHFFNEVILREEIQRANANSKHITSTTEGMKPKPPSTHIIPPGTRVLLNLTSCYMAPERKGLFAKLKRKSSANDPRSWRAFYKVSVLKHLSCPLFGISPAEGAHRPEKKRTKVRASEWEARDRDLFLKCKPLRKRPVHKI